MKNAGSQALTQALTIVKIGGNVIDDVLQLTQFLQQFAQVKGNKILIHGGGKLATELAGKLGQPQKMIDGRRVTDAETLKTTAMVYAGWINKNLVASLQALGCQSLGVSGADADLIRARKRAAQPIDYGFVGDVIKVRGELLSQWLASGLTPVLAPITHDGAGQLLNTNADSIANAVATELAAQGQVSLVFSFEKPGVLLNVDDETSVLPVITPAQFQSLRADGKIFAGMIPKLENAFKAIESGVERVILGRATNLTQLLDAKAGTCITHE